MGSWVGDDIKGEGERTPTRKGTRRPCFPWQWQLLPWYSCNEVGGIKQDNKMFIRLVAPQKKSYTSITGNVVGVKTINEVNCNCSNSFHCLVRLLRVLQFPNQIAFTQSSCCTNSDQNFCTTYKARTAYRVLRAHVLRVKL